MDQYEELKKHYVAAKAEYLKACARYDYFESRHSAGLDDDEEDVVIRLNALYWVIQMHDAEARRIFKHMVKVVGDFDSIIDKDLYRARRPKMHANALVDLCLDCNETGFLCRIHIYIMNPREYYAKLLKDTVKKTDSDLYFILYDYVNSQKCNDGFELIDKLDTVCKDGGYVDRMIKYVSDNDILNGDRGFLNRYIDDTIRRYYIEEYDKKHKEG